MFYDGECPLCRREVAHYRRLDHARRIEWSDITQEPDRLDSYGISMQAAMQRLHVRDGNGVMHTGAYAFNVLWQQLPYYRRFAWLIEKSGLLPLLDWAYVRFAGWRLRRRCTEGVCDRQ
jgi:predicted DCC family thiol-disulfide oxidoreductase YuxK